MSQSQQASSQALQQEINELIHEIAFQNVLLSSIDDSVQNREAAEHDVREEIRTLERQLRDLKRSASTSTTMTASNPRIPPSSQQIEASSSNSSHRNQRAPATAADDRSATTMNGFLTREQWHPQASASSTASTPNSADSLGDLVSPSRLNLPTRKRSHSKHLEGALAPIEGSKSRRTSPSPYLTGPTTPSTTSSGDDKFDSIEGDFYQQQRDEEERIRLEKMDEEFARSIQDGFLDAPAMSHPSVSPSAIGPPLRSGPSAFDRLAGAHQQPSSLASTSSSAPSYPQSGTSSRLLPWKMSVGGRSTNPEHHSKSSGVKRETPSASHVGFSPYALADNSTRVKTDFKNESSSSRPMPGSFQEYSSDDDDSDIEIIPPSAFHDNGRHPRTLGNQPQDLSGNGYSAPRPRIKQSSFSPESRTIDNAALRLGQAASNDALQLAMFGRQPMPKWMNEGSASQTATPPPGYYNPLLQPAMGNPSSWVYSNGLLEDGQIPSAFSMNNSPGVFMGNGLDHAGPSQGFGNMSSNPNPLADIIARSSNRNYGELSDYLNLDERMSSQVDYIMNDPRKTTQEIKDLLENIRPDVELPPEDREGTPEGLVYPLYEHQKLALTWLKSMEEGTNKGGILADDMGLGKTISALALMLARPSIDRACKTTLIVGPVALVRQWDREIRTKIKSGFKFSTHMVHGQTKKLSWDELRVYDVVLTTYGTLGAEFKRLEKWLEKKRLDGHREYDITPMKKLFPLLGPKSQFYRVFLDEAQCIKNKATMAARAACNLRAIYRFCLTGTPMMNNVGELYSLIHFLRIKPYNEWTRFQQSFAMLTKGDSKTSEVATAMRKLQALLKAILLRRTKKSEIDGKPIINLPPKTEEIQHVVFSEDEQAFYNALESKTQIQFNKYLKAGTVGKHYSNILVLLLRLRQACCHPHLIHDYEEAAPAGADLSLDAMMELARGLAPDVVARILAADDAFECPVCYDAAENPSIITPCGHDTCPECLTKITYQAEQQNIANGNEGGGASKCPTCRGDLVINKVIHYTAFKKVHKPDPAEDDETASDNSDSETESESESEDNSDSDDDMRKFIVPDGMESTEDEAESVQGEDGDDEAEVSSRKSKSKGKGKETEEKRRRKAKKGKKKADTPKHISIAMLKKEASRSADGRRRYMKYLRKNWQPSAKVTKCVELLESFLEDGQKTIIFSQFVSLLDLLQVPIDGKDWNCLRYDGGMSADARNNAINKFTDSPNHNIMLISLKAGNAGLNLVAASRVIILDPFWNPFIEMQAIDRAYRIGQQRPVEVHRILIQSTVEDRIIELQERKRRLVESALDEDANKNIGRLGVQQLAFLFGVGGGP